MFTTFKSSTMERRPHKPRRTVDRRSSSGIKRSQVGAACENCRVQRIRCDDVKPCRACRNRNIECNALQSQMSVQAAVSGDAPASRDEQPGAYVPYGDEADSAATSSRSLYAVSFRGAFARVRACACQLALEHALDVGSALQDDLFAALCIGEDIPHDLTHGRASTADTEMTLTQHRYLLQSFWDSIHCLYPILDHGSFMLQQAGFLKSDNINAQKAQKSSAIVELVTALCVQLSSKGADDIAEPSTSSAGGRAAMPEEHAAIVNDFQIQRVEHAPLGWRTFITCQGLMSQSSMLPSLSQLEAISMSTIFLIRSGRNFAARAALASAIQLAGSLADEDLTDQSHQIQQSRIWLTFYSIDTLLSVSLGCACLIADDSFNKWTSKASQHLKGDPPLRSARGQADWTQYNIQLARLMSIFRGARRQCLNDAGQMDLTEDGVAAARALEEKAQSFNRDAMHGFVQLRDTVPSYLKTARTDGAPPLSIYQSPLRLDFYSPTWLHRQRIWLEVHYHEIKMGLWLGFVGYPSTSETLRPLVESHQCACLHHAMANAFILEQAMVQLNLVEGPEEVVQHLFRSAMCVCGFLFAQPLSTLASPAMKSLSKAYMLTEKLETYTWKASRLRSWINAMTTVAKAHMTALQPSTPAPSVVNSNMIPQTFDAPAVSDDFMIDLLGFEGIPPVDGMWSTFSEPYVAQ